MGKKPFVEDPYEQEPLLPGDPGYRTQGDSYGFDPLDTSLEASLMEGKLIRNLLTLRLRTKKTLHIVLWAIVTIILFIPSFVGMIGVIGDWVRDNYVSEAVVVITAPMFLCSSLSLINLLINIVVVTRIEKKLRKNYRSPK